MVSKYQLLGRLQSDCEYYLNEGNRNTKRLWAGNEVNQIRKMKEIYNSIPKDKKPKWITYEDILRYEKLMVNFYRILPSVGKLDKEYDKEIIQLKEKCDRLSK